MDKQKGRAIFPFATCPIRKENNVKKIELLAPVGKMENALAAIENGANAIFVGGKAFNARQYADNFESDELEKIVHYCKLRGVETHITVNTLIKEAELQDLMTYLGYLEALQVDAVIVQDFGVAKLIKEHFPNLTMHASTQMTAHSLEDVKFLEQCGFKRVVLSRELQLEEIRFIKANTSVEIESFVHGALCYSYSGQCLLSSLIGGRSGNRGRCAQPCRMTYSLYEGGERILEELYLMSPKDICTLSILPELIACGIDSFKIEGRMKSPEYVASVTKIYRKYIDLAIQDPAHYKVEEEDLHTLQSIFNRGGFSEGYYHQKAGKTMLTEKTPKNIGLHIGHVVKYNPKKKLATFYTNKELHPGDGLEIWNTKKHTGAGICKVYPKGEEFTLQVEGWVDEGSPVYLSKNHELLKSLKKTYEKSVRKLPIDGKVEGCIGEPLRFTLMYKEHQVTVEGEVLQAAENKPLTEEAATKQLSKLGSTPFVFETLEVLWPDNAYMNVSGLNALRREAVERLEVQLCAVGDQKQLTYEKPNFVDNATATQTVAQVCTMAQLQACLTSDAIDAIYWEWQYDDEKAKEALAYCQEKAKPLYLVLPAIMKNETWQKYGDALKQWEETAIAGYVVRTYGAFRQVSQSPKEKIIDYTLNIMNNENTSHWLAKGATAVTPSLELSKEELLALEGPLEKIIYGHMPVMTTEQCILGNYGKCMKHKAKVGSYTLEDRKQCQWPLVTDCVSCKMQVLMEKPLLLHPQKAMAELPIPRHRLVFTQETKEEVEAVLQHLYEDEPLQKPTQLGIFFKPIE
ncbi:MAG: DUF3656 domain-containing U32 family peptidase [Cellulosilyticaceae bacterium]